MSGIVQHKRLSLYTEHNRIELVRGGKKYFDLLINLVNNAVGTIHIQVYIFSDDETGHIIAAALERAAARGVKVFVLVDGYASQGLSRNFVAHIRNSGIQFRFFEPIFKSHDFYFGRRLHHKVIVIDKRYSMVGGINIADRYNDIGSEPAWMDWGIFAEGEVSAELDHVCEELWTRSITGSIFSFRHELPAPFLMNENCRVRVRRNDWVRKYNQVSGSYLEMFNNAAEQVTIMSSYFLPGKVMRKKMEEAARRGVKIRLVLTGRSDVRISKYAERYIYQWIFKNKIRLYEYQDNVLHGKLSTYDNKYVTVGSYNVNFISAYASIELNLDICNEAFAGSVNQTIDAIIEKNCIEIFPGKYLPGKNLVARFLNRASYDIIQFIFFLFTFYYKPKRD